MVADAYPAVRSEDHLVQQAVEGDSEAFAALYELYVSRIYRFVFFRVGDRQTAEDLTSQSFLKAWDKLDSCHKRGVPFGSWLYRIARNTVVDYYRTRRETLPLEFDRAAPGHANSDIDKVERREEIDRLRQALHGLTPEQRDVLTLKFIDGLSTEEVARAMGKRPGAIRALQMRGLKALAAVLRPARHSDA